MSRVYYDTEFLENGKTIKLISIGLICDTGDSYYAVNADMPWEKIKRHDWLVRNVVPHLPIKGTESLERYLAHPPNVFPQPAINLVQLDRTFSDVKPKWVIANEVREFLSAVLPGELWAWYGAYDHVALMQLWGRMIDRPNFIPMWTNDLRQEMERLGVPRDDLPAQNQGEHNALDDAMWNMQVHEYLGGVPRS